MLCDFCHEKDAVIFLEQLSGGEKRKINMCVDCALERGITTDPKSIEASIGDLFKELSDITRRLKADNSRLCPVCGTKVGEIRKYGKVGCPECYSIFKGDIKKFLQDSGVKGSYSGSMPARLATVRSVLSDRVSIQKKLNAAVEQEDYEKAAMYRDLLKTLEKTAVADGNQNPLAEEQI